MFKVTRRSYEKDGVKITTSIYGLSDGPSMLLWIAAVMVLVTLLGKACGW